MNKKLFVKVKDLCKDTGLSEKYLKAITEKMSGSIKDDSTDEEIESVANLIVDVAKESQGEATRWANKKTETKPKKEEEEEEEEEKDKLKSQKGKVADDAYEKRFKDMEKKLADYEAKETKAQRTKDILSSMEKHKIPAYLRERLAKSISDDEDIEEAVSTLRQGMITDGLLPESQEGSKAASEKQIDEAADSLLESITVK